MKRQLGRTALLCAMLCAVLMTFVCAAQPGPDNFQPGTEALLLVDLNTGERVYARNADEVRSIASLTKIMTYIVTVENVDDLDHARMKIEDAPLDEIRGRGASVAGLEDRVGETLPVLDVLYGLMVPSGCDAGAELAWYVGGGDMQAFVDKMNAKAQELGCAHTHYADSHGLSSENQSTAEDLYRIVTYAMQLPHFWEIVNTTRYTISGANAPIYSSVSIMDQENGGRYYYPYAHGIKTGYTGAAGRCLISTATKGEQSYLCVALGGEYSAETGRVNFAMLDSAALYRWAFDTYTDNIAVDIPGQFLALQPGDSSRLSAEITENDTGETPELIWTSSHPEAVSVDENGTVTALAEGQAVITVQSQTGNVDTCTVTVGGYNGILVSANTPDEWGTVLNWQAVSDAGMEFALIRAGWTDDEGVPQPDPALAGNLAGAAAEGLRFGITYSSLAQDAGQAAQEAQLVAGQLDSAVGGTAEFMTLPVFLDLTAEQYTEMDEEQVREIAASFRDVLAARGYTAACYGPGALLRRLDPERLEQDGMEVWAAAASRHPDLSEPYTIGREWVPEGWTYKTSLYLPGVSEKGQISQCLLYMPDLEGASAPELEASASDGGVSLRWTSPDCEMENYVIYRGSGDDGELSALAQLPGDTRSYTDTTAQEGETYRYQVSVLADDALYAESRELLRSESIQIRNTPGASAHGETVGEGFGGRAILLLAVAAAMIVAAVLILTRVLRRRR